MYVFMNVFMYECMYVCMLYDNVIWKLHSDTDYKQTKN